MRRAIPITTTPFDSSVRIRTNALMWCYRPCGAMKSAMCSASKHPRPPRRARTPRSRLLHGGAGFHARDQQHHLRRRGVPCTGLANRRDLADCGPPICEESIRQTTGHTPARLVRVIPRPTTLREGCVLSPERCPLSALFLAFSTDSRNPPTTRLTSAIFVNPFATHLSSALSPRTQHFPMRFKSSDSRIAR